MLGFSYKHTHYVNSTNLVGKGGVLGVFCGWSGLVPSENLTFLPPLLVLGDAVNIIKLLMLSLFKS